MKISILVMFLLGLTLPCETARGAETQIGFVDIGKSFDEYQKTKDADQLLEVKGEAKQQEREKKVEEIKRLKDEMGLLSEEARKKKQAELDEELKGLQDFDVKVRDELRRERDSIVRDILKEINEIINEYGSKHGYGVILNDRVLLYGREEMDVTGQIIQILNERYKGKKR